MNIDWTAVGSVGQWISGFATVAAVIVALKLQRKYERRDRPVLSVRLEPGSDECLPYVPPEFASAQDQPRSDGSAEREELWLRVLVENSGDTAARDVQVRLIGILREKDKQPESRSNLWFKAGGFNSTSIDLLPRGISQPFDIAFVCHKMVPVAEVSFHLMIVKPDIGPWPQVKAEVEKHGSQNALDNGWRYLVHIAVLSNNADAVHYKFAMRLNPPRATDVNLSSRLGAETLKTFLVVEPDLK